MLTAPNSEIYLLKTPIELDNNNQLNFATAAAQQTYFQGLPKLNITEATFQRKDGTLRWPGSMESLLGYNYCMYRNKNHGNKWFYAFVTDIQWASENSSIITLKTDVWQTYQFELTWHPCFVEREHVSDDTFGKHTIPEGIEYGDYIVSSHSKVDIHADLTECCVIVQVSDLVGQLAATYGNKDKIYNGVPQGCWLLVFPVYYSDQYVLDNLDTFVRCYDDFGKANAIVSMFLVPSRIFPTGVAPVPLSFTITNSSTGNTWTFGCGEAPKSYVANILETSTVSKPTTLNGYTPVNNKCFCSPYSFLNVTNNAGSVVSYAWELFDSTPSFTTTGVLTQGCDIKITPTNYRNANAAGNYDMSVTCSKFPLLSWNSDYYLNWCAVNQPIMEVEAGLTAVGFGLGAVWGMVTGDFSGAQPAELGKSVAGMMQQIREAKMTPDSAKGNLTGGDLTYSLGRIGFSFQKMTIRYEYAKMIDDYFSCFGYKVNSLKNPNINGRLNWNYVKTVGCNVTGDIPQEDIEEVRGLFDRGITIWHNPSTFLDYTQSNTIVS